MSRHHWGRAGVITAAVGSLTLALAGCSGGDGGGGDAAVDLSSPAPTGVTITLWHASNDPDALLNLYKAYEKESGNTIKLVDIPSDTAPTVVQTKWATGERPDLLEYNPSPQDMAQLNMSENMLDLSSLEFVGDSALSGVAGTIDGKTYGAILGPVSVYGMYYNKDVLAKAGVDAPTNEETLKAACTAIKGTGVTPISMAGGSEWPAMMLPGFTYMGDFNADNAYGEGVASGETKVNDASGPLVAGLQMVTDLKDAGCFNKDAATQTFEQAEKAVSDGTAAFTFLPSDQIPDFYKNGASTDAVDASIGFGAFSAVKGVPSYGPNAQGSFFVPKTGDTDKERVAADFIDWATTDGYQQFVDDAQIVPTLNTADASSLSGLYADAAKLLQSDDAVIGFNSSIPGFGNFGGLAVKVLVGQSTAQDAADSFQTFVDQAIDAQKK